MNRSSKYEKWFNKKDLFETFTATTEERVATIRVGKSYEGRLYRNKVTVTKQ